MTTTVPTSTTTSSTISPVTGLPHWETIPDDLPAAIAEIKAAIKARIEESGRTVAEVIAEIETFLEGEIADIQAAKARGEEVWPVIDYADIAAGTVSPETLALLKRRGCAVVRGHFDRAPGRAVGRRRGRLRGVQPLLRELRRAGRRLLRDAECGDEQARDLPDLLVERPDGGADAPADGDGAGVPEQPVDATRRRAASGSTRTPTPSTPTGSADARRAPTPAASAPTSIRARSTCG